MRNLKRLAALLMAAALILSMSATAFAAVDDTGFSDVDANAWYAEAATYCRDNGLMSGTGAAAFSPDATMTRAMLAVVLYRLSGSPAVTGSDAFTDTTDGAWYSNAVLWASQQGLVSGYGSGLFGTNDPVSREQIATILWRYDGSPEAESGTDFADEGTIASYAAAAVDWARANGVINGMSGNVFSPKSSATRAQVAAILMSCTRQEQTDPLPTPQPTPEPEQGNRVLVAYFSATNNTEGAAQLIADSLDADTYEIVPAVPYTSADLDYNNSSSRTTIEMNDPNSRPEISGSVNNMEDYDIIFLGYPIWWGQAPRIISTFLESYDFEGKTIVPFCTSASSGIGSSAANLHSLTDGAAWLSGQRFSSGASRNTVVSWIDGLGLDVTAN